MPRQMVASVETNFGNGLITEATALTFPQNAVTETYNCEFQLDGSVKRRLGFDFESGFTLKNIDRLNQVVTTYLWKNVAGNGDVSLLVAQIGATIYFYRTNETTGFSPGAIADTVALTPVSGAANVETVEAQFSDGNGLLFVTHPYCEPMRISFDTSADNATATNITIKVRDFEGATADPYAVDERPTATLAGLNVSHKYNLYNQGWNTTNLTAWDTAQSTMPSNADVMWLFKDSNDDFDASAAAIARPAFGNTPAPKGHFILTLSSGDRDSASGLTGVSATATGAYRPSTSAFFAGRLFYAGIANSPFNSNIYFSQLVERTEQYGLCYQVNDPTSETLFDLLPTDGGTISIPEAGTIFKLVSVPGGLCVHAANGVWFITGSTGLGFSATDYTVQAISNIATLSASSFVTVQGYPSWWNSDGIYLMAAPQSGSLPIVRNITDDKIKSFYQAIDLEAKKSAKGIWHATDNHLRWIYRSEGTIQLTERYEYDRVLNLNLRTGAFYPWSITDSDVKVHAIVVSDIAAGAIAANNVANGAGDLVIDADGNQVIMFESSGVELSPFDKYFVSYRSGGTTNRFTFADKTNASYKDWFTYDTVGEYFDSYFVSGYRLAGGGSRKFQNNWVTIYSRLSDYILPVEYYFQAMWDFANTGDSGRWSSRQLVSHSDDEYDSAAKRLKVRGHGLAMQFRVTSVDGEPFDIIGWSAIQSSNQIP